MHRRAVVLVALILAVSLGFSTASALAPSATHEASEGALLVADTNLDERGAQVRATVEAGTDGEEAIPDEAPDEVSGSAALSADASPEHAGGQAHARAEADAGQGEATPELVQDTSRKDELGPPSALQASTSTEQAPSGAEAMEKIEGTIEDASPSGGIQYVIRGGPLDLGHIVSTWSLSLGLFEDEAASQDEQSSPESSVAWTGDAPEASPASETTANVAFLAMAPVAALAAIGAVHATTGTPWLRRLLPGLTLTPLYSRIGRDEVLDHESRAAIYELVDHHPGSTIEQIAGRLDLARSTVRHHIRTLEDADLIASSEVGRCRVHYRVGDRKQAVQSYVLQHETRARIVSVLQEAPGTVTELAESLEANAGSVYFHLQTLCEAGLVTRHEGSRITYHAAGPEEPVVFEPCSLTG